MSEVKGNQIIEDNWASNAKKEAESLRNGFDELDKIIKKITDDVGKMVQSFAVGQGVKSYNKLQKAVTNTNAAVKASVKIDKEKEKLERRLKSLRSDSIQQNEQLKVLISEQRKINRDLAKEVINGANAYEKLVKQTDAAQNNLKKLAAQYGVNSKQARKAQKEFDRLDNELRQINAAARDGRRDVGRYGEAFKKAGSSLRSFASALGLVSGVQLLARGIRDALGVMRDFNTATVNLAAISGRTAEELEPLNEQAKELGATTRFTATQVSNLQLELTKLGFDPGQIEAMTEPILNLSAALNADLATAAALTGAVLNQYALEATEATRVTDVLVKAANSAAVDFEFFNTAMSIVGPTANAVGATLEETAALLSVLANSGVDASTSATGLRNIFLELAGTGQPLGEALDEIQNSSNQAGTAFELFGKRGASIGTILANNQEQIKGLNDTLLEAGGTAQEVADKQLDSLQGSLDLLRSAWEGYILGADGASGASEKLKNGIRFLADNFKIVMKILLGALKAWALQKIAVTLFRVEVDKTGAAITRGLIPGLIRSVKAIRASATAFRFGAISVKTFSASLKSIPFVGIISGITTIISLFSSMEDEADNATESVGRFEDGQSALQDSIKESEERLVSERAKLRSVFDALKDTTAGTKEREDALKAVNQEYGTTLENLETEDAFVRQLDVAYQNLTNTLKAKIRLEITQAKRVQLIKELIVLEDELAQAQKEAFESPFQEEGQFDVVSARELDLRGRILQLQILINQLDDVPIEGILESTGSAAKATTKELKTQAEINRQTFSDVRKQNKENLTAIENDARKSGDSQEEVAEKVKQARIKFLKLELQLALKLFGEFSEEYIAANVRLNKRLDENNPAKNQRLENEKEYKLIQQQNIENLKILEADLIEQGENVNKIRAQLNKERLDGLRENAEKAAELFGTESKEFIEANLALQKEIRRQNKETANSLIKSINNVKDTVKDFFKILDDIASGIEKNLDNRIAAQEREIEASKSRVEGLREEAAAGNILAEESIKAEEKRQAQAQEEISELERKRNQLLIATTALKALSQAIDSGDQNAFANVPAKLTEFLGGLPKLYSGTERTIADELGRTGTKDGHLLWADDNEMILNPKKVSALKAAGIDTTDQVVNSAVAYQNRGLVRGIITPEHESSGLNTNALADKMIAGFKQAVAEIPSQTFNYDAATKMATEVMKKGNKVITKKIRIG